MDVCVAPYTVKNKTEIEFESAKQFEVKIKVPLSWKEIKKKIKRIIKK